MNGPLQETYLLAVIDLVLLHQDVECRNAVSADARVYTQRSTSVASLRRHQQQAGRFLSTYPGSRVLLGPLVHHAKLHQETLPRVFACAGFATSFQERASLATARCRIGSESAFSFGNLQLYIVERQRFGGARLGSKGLAALIGLKGACSLPSRMPCTTPRTFCRQSS